MNSSVFGAYDLMQFNIWLMMVLYAPSIVGKVSTWGAFGH